MKPKKTGIYQKALDSFDFEYKTVPMKQNDTEKEEHKEDLSKAIKSIPKKCYNLRKVDYYA